MHVYIYIYVYVCTFVSGVFTKARLRFVSFLCRFCKIQWSYPVGERSFDQPLTDWMVIHKDGLPQRLRGRCIFWGVP